MVRSVFKAVVGVVFVVVVVSSAIKCESNALAMWSTIPRQSMDSNELEINSRHIVARHKYENRKKEKKGNNKTQEVTAQVHAIRSNPLTAPATHTRFYCFVRSF